MTLHFQFVYNYILIILAMFSEASILVFLLVYILNEVIMLFTNISMICETYVRTFGNVCEETSTILLMSVVCNLCDKSNFYQM